MCLPPLEYGPHKKLSRGEEQYKYLTEFKFVKERKFICSLDLLLDLFVGHCRFPGCLKVPKVKYHFVRATVVVTALVKVVINIGSALHMKLMEYMLTICGQQQLSCCQAIILLK